MEEKAAKRYAVCVIVESIDENDNEGLTESQFKLVREYTKIMFSEEKAKLLDSYSTFSGRLNRYYFGAEDVEFIYNELIKD